jgi:hypothetical protein
MGGLDKPFPKRANARPAVAATRTTPGKGTTIPNAPVWTRTGVPETTSRRSAEKVPSADGPVHDGRDTMHQGQAPSRQAGVVVGFIMLGLSLTAVPGAVAAPATIVVDFHTNGLEFTVTSDKDISNVIVLFCGNEFHKHDDLSGLTFSHSEPEAIIGIWVKSGDNHDPNGPPGAGEFFEGVPTHCHDNGPPGCEPTGLQVVSVAGPKNIVSWDFNTDADGFNIYRALGAGPFVHIGTAPSGETMHEDADVVSGTHYRYRVTALHGEHEGDGCGSVEIITIPVFPSAWAAVGAGTLAVAAVAMVLRRRS